MIGGMNNRGIDVGNMFQGGMDAVSQRGEALQQKMGAMMNKKTVNPQDMIAVQFELGQYNVMMESLSSVTKSLTETLKSLSQRTA